MERKRYLELCQRNAAYPQSVVVWFDGIQYNPIEYRLRFNEKGEVIHTAVLKDLKANCLVNCDLERVEEK